MDFKSITTFIRDAGLDTNVLNVAASLAAENEAHLSAYCLGIDQTHPGAYYAGANAIALEGSLRTAQAEAIETEARVEASLSLWSIQYSTMAVTAQIGALGPVIGTQAFLSDLVVLGLPYGEGRGPEDVVVVESALFKTRVPVLVTPPAWDDKIKTESIVIAWNESPEALAAIRSALPFLRRAENVDIAIIDPPAHSPDRSDVGGPLAEMLSRHGVRANISVLARTMSRVSDIISRHCEDKSADMLVMGAYGHSRLREAILGGATRNLLEQTEIPTLLAH